MKKNCLLIMIVLLTGCPAPGDRMVARESATVTLRNHHVCVVSPLTSHERITAVQINTENHHLLHNIFDDNPIYVPEGECLPLFDIPLLPGRRYFIAYDITAQNKPSRLITADFSIPVE